jgi:Cache domain
MTPPPVTQPPMTPPVTQPPMTPPVTQPPMTPPPVTGGPAATGGEHLLADITALIERVLASVAEVAEAMTAVAAAARTGRRPLRRADLAALRPLVAQVLARHRGFAAGAGVVLAPDTLADAPRCIDWWWADQGIGQLEVDLDPSSAEFYDYTTTEWYREPARTGWPCIAGPYVDYICTHKYTFTVSVPVVDDGRFVGVAGADILAGEVERMLLPGLSMLGRADRPAVLVSGSGRVIASGTASILPGTVLRPAGPVTAAGPLPWILLSGPALPAPPGGD